MNEKQLMEQTRLELETILFRLEELLEWAEDEGYKAIFHKLQETLGPLWGTVTVTEQYRDGLLVRTFND